MPPHLLGDLSNATYSNIEQQYMQFSTLTLSPWISRLESSLRPLAREWAVANAREANFDWRVKFSLEGLKRGDSRARAALYNALRNNGALSPNEIRELEDMNPYKGGDSHYMNAAYAPIGPDGKLLVPEGKVNKAPKVTEEQPEEDVTPES
jgi:HK97 family phage portal protein